MNVRIVVDSTADVTDEIRAKLSVVPLTVHFGEQEYVDGITINHKQFYEMLVETDVLPTTSQPSPEAFAQVFRQAQEAGEQVVALTVSSKLSGTCQSAMIAAADFPDSVWVVDTKTVAIGCGILAELAVRLKEEGLSAEEIVARLEEERDNIRVIALLDTLEYLKKGGRISKTVAFAGGLLSIKPVVTIQDGEIHILGKARGSKQGNNLLVTEIQKAGGVDFTKPLMLGYTGLSDALLEKYVLDSGALWDGHGDCIQSTPICSVIGTHAGPGAIAVAFFKQ
ncbi:MAG: DegV family protein [Bacteroidales bacterium]|jgi:DegV family protein with EDD domain|nr:DegV family protein [Bacteroidales bacterium]